VRGGIDERLDDLEELDNRARPTVRHDQRPRVNMLRTQVHEVDVDAVDLGHELRQSV